MRKRIFAGLLASVLVLAGCGGNTAQTTEPEQTEQTQQTQEQVNYPLPESVSYTVASPMSYPDYTFDHTPTTDEMRAMAVQAMKDMLSVQWSVAEFSCYRKESTGSGKLYAYAPQNTYAGLPYSQADGCIVQWFEFYDQQTGRITLPGDFQLANSLIGNTCAGAVCAAWSTVCASVDGYCSTTDLVPANGFVPVGDYTIPVWVTSYSVYSTDSIIQDNGEEKIFASYAQILPADGLVSTPDVHAIMAIEAANVVYKADGSIDPELSTVTIADQRAGEGKGWYNVVEGDEVVFYSGRIGHVYSFRELCDLGYIPITMPELVGQKEYEAAAVTYEGDPEDILDGRLLSNYPLCYAKLILVDENGEETLVHRELLSKRDIPSGRARSLSLSFYSLDSQEFRELLEPGKTYTLKCVTAASNGQIFTPVQMQITG